MDISWIIEQEKLENIQKKCIREYFSTIELVSIYVNDESEIETIEKETMDINNMKVLDIQLLKEWSIQKQKYTPKSIFELKETLWFHVDLEPEQIQNIDEKSSCFLKSMIPLEEIKITPSIFIFHSLTTLFFIFQEKNKSITSIEKKHKKDKKKHTLRIILPTKHKNQMRITRKNPSISNT
jgi:hypothetical protein